MVAAQHPLFVYGTLLTGESAHDLLASHAQHVEPGVMPDAALYSLGAYPMIVRDSGSVTGEVCWLAPDAYAELLTRLDRYEGPQYARQLCTVRTGRMGNVQAWVYVGTELPADATPCPSGDWRRHTRQGTA